MDARRRRARVVRVEKEEGGESVWVYGERTNRVEVLQLGEDTRQERQPPLLRDTWPPLRENLPALGVEGFN